MPPSAAIALDAFDLRILAMYQHDVRLPAERIGDQVGLSAAAVQRRLKRLRENGVIEAEVARIAPRAVGLPITCIVTIDLDRETAAELARFKARMAACAEKFRRRKTPLSPGGRPSRTGASRTKVPVSRSMIT